MNTWEINFNIYDFIFKFYNLLPEFSVEKDKVKTS